MIADTFTPLSGLIGGALIGLAAVVLLFLTGRIAGISGIAGGLFTIDTKELPWRAAFVVGLIVGPLVAGAMHVAANKVDMQAHGPWLVAAGLLVGFGTRLGNGCTSGHGVCGLARGSGRSLAATITFMLTAIVTVALLRHVF
jgi:uncharacterized membrane protein YedE/YeeE